MKRSRNGKGLEKDERRMLKSESLLWKDELQNYGIHVGLCAGVRFEIWLKMFVKFINFNFKSEEQHCTLRDKT